jgi:hypothetical protein
MIDSAATTLSYSLLDYHVTIAAADPEGRAALDSILRGFPRHPASERSTHYALERDDRGWIVEQRATRTGEGLTLAQALMMIEGALVVDMLASRRDRFHLHGAALCNPSGNGSILILGASGAGKTTLTLALMARGFLPYADDVIVMEPDDLTPQTFQRAFHVNASTRRLIAGLTDTRPWSLDDVPDGYLMPRRWAESPANVRAIFFPTLQPCDTPAVTALSIPEAAATLLPFSATLDQAPRIALAAAARLTAQAICYTLVSGDLRATADLVANAANDAD